MTKHLRGTINAWHFWFGCAFEVTTGKFKFSYLRCLPLNAALCLPGDLASGRVLCS
ncbi:acetyltransferase [Vibrio cincinnatiensis]|nr:acetyltransferase [Vibrio cincinnatiensis]MCG3748747.1 acetyltransferase [Vibrio cincinnatiensis]